MPIGQIGMQAATGAIGGLMGMAFAGANDRRQLAMQQKLNEMQWGMDKRMYDYQMGKQLQMWKDTSYGAQKEQMIAAGLNPGLMYGMGGGGGQTAGGGMPSSNAKNAPTGGGEMLGAMGMAMQLQLLKAQKENIEADTANKKGDAENKPQVGKNLKADTVLKDQQQYAQGIDNAFKLYLQSTTPEGNDTDNIHESIRGQHSNKELQQLNEKIREIGSSIGLMGKKGLEIDQIIVNLKKEGKLKDAEIEWNALNLKEENFGKFLTNAIKMLLKPR